VKRAIPVTLLVSLVFVAASPGLAQTETFVRGDCNGGGDLSDAVTDAVHLLAFLFVGGVEPQCLDACDANDDGSTDLSDALYRLSFSFNGGPAPPPPFPECGPDPTSDALACALPPCVTGGDLPALFGHFLASVEISLDGDQVVLRTDDVPNHPSPYFGVGDARYEEPHEGMHVNPNRILEQDITLRVPLHPEAAASSSDTSLGPIGMSVSGVVLFNQFAAGFSPLDNEIQSFDIYNGHPAGGGRYHYHIEPVYLTEDDLAALVGVMLDGFPLYGPKETDGSLPTGLDDCNGHFGVTPDHPDEIYHYHVTDMEPYFVGCFTGDPGSVTQ